MLSYTSMQITCIEQKNGIGTFIHAHQEVRNNKNWIKNVPLKKILLLLHCYYYHLTLKMLLGLLLNVIVMQSVFFYSYLYFQNLCGSSQTSILLYNFQKKHSTIQSDYSLFSSDWQDDCRFNSQLQLWQHASSPLKVFPHLLMSCFTSVSITTSSEREMEIAFFRLYQWEMLSLLSLN